jgi:hypothetical protein
LIDIASSTCHCLPRFHVTCHFGLQLEGKMWIVFHLLRHVTTRSRYTTISYPCSFSSFHNMSNLFTILTQNNFPLSIEQWSEHVTLYLSLFLWMHRSFQHTRGRAHWGASSCTQSARILGLNSRRYGAPSCFAAVNREVQPCCIRFLRCLLPWIIHGECTWFYCSTFLTRENYWKQTCLMEWKYEMRTFPVLRWSKTVAGCKLLERLLHPDKW